MAPDLKAQIEEAKLIVEKAQGQGLTVRLLGGLAVASLVVASLIEASLVEAQLQADPIPGSLRRTYSDMDLALLEKKPSAFEEFISSFGFIPEKGLTLLNGDRSLLFKDWRNGKNLDVFIGNFEMCHVIPFSDRLKGESLTLPPAELLLTKLQIIELNRKDAQDILSLLLCLGAGRGIDAPGFSALVGNDWGLWKTAGINLEKIRSLMKDFSLSPGEESRIGAGIEALLSLLASCPKTSKWKMRSLIGEKIRWYEEPEEVEGID